MLLFPHALPQSRHFYINTRCTPALHATLPPLAVFSISPDRATLIPPRLNLGRRANGRYPIRNPAANARSGPESVFTFAGKIRHAQTFQDIVTLQTQFAQDRMQAFTTQTQELYKLIRGNCPEVATRLIVPSYECGLLSLGRPKGGERY